MDACTNCGAWPRPKAKLADVVKDPFNLVPRYKTNNLPCKYNKYGKRCGGCRNCLCPEPREHFKLISVHRSGPRNIPPGGYYEIVQAVIREDNCDYVYEDQDYYIFGPIYLVCE